MSCNEMPQVMTVTNLWVTRAFEDKFSEPWFTPLFCGEDFLPIWQRWCPIWQFFGLKNIIFLGMKQSQSKIWNSRSFPLIILFYVFLWLDNERRWHPLAPARQSWTSGMIVCSCCSCCSCCYHEMCMWYKSYIWTEDKE